MRFSSLLKAVNRRSRFEAEMDSELRDHMEKHIQALITQGMSRSGAEMRARREFGVIESIKEECRDSKGFNLIDGAARNFRFAWRSLRKNPAFACTAIATLILCIGANTAIFSVVDGVLFRPLSYPEQNRLGRILRYFHSPQGEEQNTSIDGRTWEYLRDHVRTLDLALHARAQGANLSIGTGAEYIQQLRVSTGFFRVLGVRPFLGREIEPDEDRPKGPAVAVLNNSLWKRVLHSDPDVVGKKIMLRGEPYTVVGVMPAGFNTMPPVDVWTPLRPSRQGEGGGSNYGLIARLRPGYEWPQGDAELAALGASYTSDTGMNLPAGSWLRFKLGSVQRTLANDGRVPLAEPLQLLWAAVGLILLIGCVNIAGLTLARGVSRQHEIATRLALGSGRLAILGQLLSESLLIAILGGIGGLIAGYGLLDVLRRMAVRSLELKQPMTVDWRVLAMTAAVALLASLLFGLYPAWEASRIDIRTGLVTAGRSLSAHRRAWVRRGLVICEVALGIVLLVSAGLMLRTLAYFTGMSPGYDGHNVLTANMSLQDARYATAAKVNNLFDTSLARIAAIPGVEAAGVGLTLPYERALNDGVRIVDGPGAMPEPRSINVTYVTPGYFEALRMKLVAGRLFKDSDRPDSLPVAIVNESFVHRFFKDDSPIGRHLNPNQEIVGVIGDVPEVGFSTPIGMIANVYVPAFQQSDNFFQLVHTWFTPSWVIRSSGPQASTISAVTAAIASTDEQLPIAKFRTMDEIRFNAMTLQRLESTLLGALAALALVLAAIGIYGLIAHSVGERTREFGIRLALGCSVSKAIEGAIRPGVVLAAIGAVVGCLLARWAARLMEAIIFGVRPTDAMTYVTVVCLLMVVAGVASAVPCFRIARIDPARTLREE